MVEGGIAEVGEDASPLAFSKQQIGAAATDRQAKLLKWDTGRDLIVNTSKGGQLWGDAPNSILKPGTYLTEQRVILKTITDANGNTSVVEEIIANDGTNADNFAWAPDTIIMDPQIHDILTFFGLPLVGGSDEGGIGLSVTGLGLAGSPIGFAQLFTRPLATIYEDQILPFINYGFEKQADGSYDLLVGNVFQGFLDATEALFTNHRTGLSAELKKHYGVQRVKDYIPAESKGVFAVTYRGTDQLELAKKKITGKLGLVFKKANPIAAILALLPQDAINFGEGSFH